MNEPAVANYVDKVQKMPLLWCSTAIKSNVKCALNRQNLTSTQLTYIISVNVKAAFKKNDCIKSCIYPGALLYAIILCETRELLCV